jgi:hypothetical protein
VKINEKYASSRKDETNEHPAMGSSNLTGLVEYGGWDLYGKSL